MQIPFPPENPAETMSQKGLSLPHQNKNQEIQTLIYDGQSWLEIAAGALFQTLAVTQKLRLKAQGTRHKAEVKEPEFRSQKSDDRGQTTDNRREHVSKLEFLSSV